VFQDPFPSLIPSTNRPVLHIPQIFNYKAIDGVIVKKEPVPGRQKQQLFIYLLQITVARKHKDSHKTFFGDWKKWVNGLGEFDVIPEYIWISQEGGDTKEHPQTDKWPAHVERNIAISEVDKQIGREYEIEKRRGLIQQGPVILTGGQVGMEEQEELEEQTRSDGPSAAAGKRSGKQPRAEGGGTNDYANMKRAELHALLKSRSLRLSGNKADMVARLLEDDKKRG